ncbi:MAG TPA: hypothetical protein VF876_07025 [Burkholderiales bacterium]
MSGAHAAGIALGYQPAAGEARAGERIHVPMGGNHVLPQVGSALKSALLAAVLEFRLRRGAHVVVLGADPEALDDAARAALRAQVAFLPAGGGLLSNLNAWENIALPLAYHAPQRLHGVAARVYALLEPFAASVGTLLARMPEEMTPYEKMLAAYARTVLCTPRLVLAEDLPRSLGPAERRQAESFAAGYLAQCPEGTFVRLEEGQEVADTMSDRD